MKTALYVLWYATFQPEVMLNTIPYLLLSYICLQVSVSQSVSRKFIKYKNFKILWQLIIKEVWVNRFVSALPNQYCPIVVWEN